MAVGGFPIRARNTGTLRRARQKDPRELKVQVNVQVPHWYREQLYDFCDETGKSFTSVIIGAILDKVPPRKPPMLPDWPPPFYRWEYVEEDLQ